MPNVPAPFVTLQDDLDAIQEEWRRAGVPVPPRLRSLQTRLSEQALRDATADAIRRVGMSKHARGLIRSMGYEVRALR